MPKRLPIGIGLLCLLYFGVTGYSESTDACLECRADRERKSLGGIPWDTVTPPAIPLAHVPGGNRGHVHKWRSGGSITNYSLMGRSLGCRRLSAVCALPHDVQADYSRSVSPEANAQYLRAVDSPNPAAGQSAINRVFEQYMDSLNK